MTKHLILGAMRPLKPLRGGLCAVLALVSLQAPLAHADAFSTSKNGAAPSKELMDRLSFMEQRLTDLAQQAAQHQQQAPAPGQLNLPTPPGMPGEPGAEEDLQLGYEVKGEMNGSVIVKKNDRIQVMSRADFERFDGQAKSRARMQLSQAGLVPAPMAPPAGVPNLAAKPAVAVPAGAPIPNVTTVARPAPSPSPAALRAAQANPAPKTPPVAAIK